MPSEPPSIQPWVLAGLLVAFLGAWIIGVRHDRRMSDGVVELARRDPRYRGKDLETALRQAFGRVRRGLTRWARSKATR